MKNEQSPKREDELHPDPEDNSGQHQVFRDRDDQIERLFGAEGCVEKAERLLTTKNSLPS